MTPKRLHALEKQPGFSCHWIFDIALFFLLEFLLIEHLMILSASGFVTVVNDLRIYDLSTLGYYARNELRLFLGTFFSLLWLLCFLRLFIKKFKSKSVKQYLKLYPIRREEYREFFSSFLVEHVFLRHLIGLVIIIFLYFGVLTDEGGQQAEKIKELYRPYALLKIIAFAFLGPIYEELLYRGLLFQGLRRSPLGKWGAIIGSSIMFSYAHMGWGDWPLLINTLIGGCFYGWLCHKKSIIWPIGLHMLFNLNGIFHFADFLYDLFWGSMGL